MAVPTWAVGQVLTASDVNSWFVPLAAYRTTSQSVTSSTTLVNDNALFLAVAANAVYQAELELIYDGATGGDIQIAFTVPAGATLTNTFLSGLSVTAASITDDFTTAGTTNPQLGALGSGTSTGLLARYTLTTAGTAGTLQLQFAQAASSGTATRTLAGSSLTARRVG